MLSEITPTIKILPIRPKGDKTVGSEVWFNHTFCVSHRNRILLDGKLKIEFEKEYNLHSQLPAEAGAFSPREAASEQVNTLWWCVLAQARTIFEQNGE